MRYQQHVAVFVSGLDFSDDRERAGGYLNGRFATGWRIPSRISLPTNVVMFVVLPNIVRLLIFPGTVTDFPEPIPDLHVKTHRIAQRLRCRDRPFHGTDVDIRPGYRAIPFSECLCHLVSLRCQFGIQCPTISAPLTVFCLAMA